jgi:hypothetical protein
VMPRGLTATSGYWMSSGWVSPKGSGTMPTVIRKTNGRLIIRSKGKRGFTTTQVTHEGEQWLREKFPPSHHSLHELSIEWDVFRELARAGFLFREGSGRKWITGAKRRATEIESNRLRDEFPPARRFNPPAVHSQPVASPAPLVSQRAPTPPPQATEAPAPCNKPTLVGLATIAAVKCVGCGFALPHGAHFCPRCGRAVQKQPQSITETSGGRVFFAVLGGVVAIVVLCWIVSQR